MGEGRIQSFGNKDEVLGKVLRSPVAIPQPAPLKIVGEAVGGAR
jgi:hypothetical protein